MGREGPSSTSWVSFPFHYNIVCTCTSRNSSSSGSSSSSSNKSSSALRHYPSDLPRLWSSLSFGQRVDNCLKTAAPIVIVVTTAFDNESLTPIRPSNTTAAVIVVEASVPRAYWRAAYPRIASTITLSWAVKSASDFKRTSNIFSPVASSLELLRICWTCVGLQQWSVTSSIERNEDRVRRIAVFRPEETTIHLRCPRICWWWICEFSMDWRPRGWVEDELRMVAGG